MVLSLSKWRNGLDLIILRWDCRKGDGRSCYGISGINFCMLYTILNESPEDLVINNRPFMYGIPTSMSIRLKEKL